MIFYHDVILFSPFLFSPKASRMGVIACFLSCLKLLGIFLRLDERKRRKDFILERNLLYPDPFEKQLLPEEKEICRRYRVFMRFHSKEEHENLLLSLVDEHRILKRIQDLQV